MRLIQFLVDLVAISTQLRCWFPDKGSIWGPVTGVAGVTVAFHHRLVSSLLSEFLGQIVVAGVAEIGVPLGQLGNKRDQLTIDSSRPGATGNKFIQQTAMRIMAAPPT